MVIDMTPHVGGRALGSLSLMSVTVTDNVWTSTNSTFGLLRHMLLSVNYRTMSRNAKYSKERVHGVLAKEWMARERAPPAQLAWRSL